MSYSVVELTSFVKELNRSDIARSVLVSDIPDVVVNIVDKLEIYFGKRSNGGGDVEKVTLLKKHLAVITFCNDTVIPSVLKKNPHQFHGYEVQVKPLQLCVDELKNGQRTPSEPKTAGRQTASSPRPVDVRKKVDLFETVQVTILTEQHPYILNNDLSFVRRLSRELDLTITITNREKILKFEGNWNAIHTFRSQLKEKYNLVEEDDYEETRGLKDESYKENTVDPNSAIHKSLKKNTQFDDCETTWPESKESTVAAINRNRHVKESYNVEQDMWNEEAVGGARREDKMQKSKMYLKDTSFSEGVMNHREKSNSGVGSRTPGFDEERNGMSSTIDHETWEDQSDENHWHPLERSSSKGESAISPRSMYNQPISSQPKPYSHTSNPSPPSTHHPTTFYPHEHHQFPSAGTASNPVTHPHPTTYPSTTHTPLPFKLKVNSFQITVKIGDITQQNVDTIVSSTESSLSTPIGLAGVIMRAGGDKVKDEWKLRKHGQKEGDILMLGSGRLACKRIMFVVMSVCSTWMTAQEKLTKMTQICKKVLKTLNGIGATSAAITGLGTGNFYYPSDVFVKAMLTALHDELLGSGSHRRTLQEIVFVDKNSSLLHDLATTIRFELVKGSAGYV